MDEEATDKVKDQSDKVSLFIVEIMMFSDTDTIVCYLTSKRIMMGKSLCLWYIYTYLKSLCSDTVTVLNCFVC